MILTGPQPLLEVVQWTGIGVTIGGACYGFSRAANIDTPGCAGILGGVGAIFTGVLLSYPVLVATLVCVLGALAQKVLARRNAHFLIHYLDLLFTTCLCIVIGYAIVSFRGNGVGPLTNEGLFLGLVSTPSAVPLLRWMWRSSRTRPGLDRHFTNDDFAQHLSEH